MKPFGISLAFVAVMFLAAAGGAVSPPGEWYASLIKPSWNPPSWVFGPVWSTLYVLIGLAGARVWMRRPEPWAGKALQFWGLQWALNAAWSPVFFALHQMGVALLIVGMLWVSIIMFIRLAWREDRAAAWLYVPYAAWVSFASVLNTTLWWLNRGG